MSYNIIINPKTNRKVNVYTPLGQTIIKNYLNVMNGGAGIEINLEKQHSLVTNPGKTFWRINDEPNNFMFNFFTEDLVKEYIDLFKSKEIKLTPEKISILSASCEDISDLENVCRTESMKTLIKKFVSKITQNEDIVIVKDNTKNIIGFIVIKNIGKNILEISYLCSDEDSKGLGKFLLGLVIFIYNKDGRFNRLILELDKGYSNLGVYCLYRKLGFEVNKDLLVNTFKIDLSTHSLPMEYNEQVTDFLTNTNSDSLCLRDKEPQIESIKLQIEYILTLWQKDGCKSRKFDRSVWIPIIDLLKNVDDSAVSQLKQVLYDFLRDRFEIYVNFLDTEYSFSEEKLDKKPIYDRLSKIIFKKLK